MKAFSRKLATALVLLFLPLGLSAQQREDAAVLVADNLFITPQRVLVAEGNVEAFQNGTRLRASAIRYDQEAGALSIDGPILLTEGEETTILADAAELDADLRNGLLTGARLILNERLQLAALQINRVDGRYSQLYKTAVTSCRVCGTGEPPLWQIRAKRVVHDEEAQQLYFDEAQFLIRDLPVFYLPRLRLPDPTLARATGFLTPSIRTTSELGTGLKLPYFIKIGDHRDLTLTPYLSSSTKTLELRYRQAFVNGRIQFDGAFSDDDERPGDTRAYLFGTGAFDLPRDYKLYFDIETVSDRSYLADYGYSDKDRLTSELTVSRTRRDIYLRGSLYNFESLRQGEVNDTLPTVVVDGEYERRFFPRRLGGELRFGLKVHSHRRNSDLDRDSNDPDLIVDGRDVARLNGRAEYLRRFVHRSGLVADLRAGATFNVFDITQDITFDQNHSEIAPQAALAFRYPLIRREASGATQVLEPVVQLGWVGNRRLAIPNEESTRVEFDEGNLLALSRFPAPDRRERKGTVALGVNWARSVPGAFDTHVVLGQVLREDADPAFTVTSGLDGPRSDFLLAAQIASAGGLAVTGRGLFDEDFDFAKAELRGDWTFRRGSLGGSFLWLGIDPAEDRFEEVSEVSLDATYDISRHWAAAADLRYDVADSRAANAALGLSYNNECVSVDLSVRRRYTTSTSLEPTTSLGLNIGLRGFSASTETERLVRSCAK